MKFLKHCLPLVAAAGLVFATSAASAGYFVVTPSLGKKVSVIPEPEITVNLNAGTLPLGTRNVPFSYALQPLLDVKGDPSYDASKAVFSTSTALPPGMALQPDGTLGGTPLKPTASGISIQVTAAYKDKTGQQLYQLVINGVPITASRISASMGHACVVTPEGAAKCWGENSSGQLGDGTFTNQEYPVQVAGLTSGVTQIEVGSEHTCAVHNGGVKCWGYGDDGQLGNGAYGSSATPVQAIGLTTGVTQLTAGRHHNCAIAAGKAYCWGVNDEWQLGTSASGGAQSQPQQVSWSPTVGNVTAIAASAWQTCAVADGAGYCWGNTVMGNYQLPTKVPGLTTVSKIVPGTGVTCAIQGGALQCWGNNSYGGVGDGSLTYRPNPTQVSGMVSGVSHVTVAGTFTCAVQNGGAFCWGYNGGGQLGNGSRTNSSTPIGVFGAASNIAAITGNEEYACILQGQRAKCWGDMFPGNDGAQSSAVPVDLEQ
ncbi:hypothetical protein LMG26857_03565 [Achromobacter anxifer]|uniref:RCC1 domain-containing protein n=1 Tax=Achromobacter anxifer TaxID=1287737 RepID=UPI00155D3623|nr:putative Ig domain-containing protein [Achromobacter anxifer]CAB5514506.1 hypothetical protein LMG26857_03565 [Achromobacter anxifer]